MNALQSRLAVVDSFPFSYESIELDSGFTQRILDTIHRTLSKNSTLKVVDISQMTRETVVSLLLNFDADNSEIYFFGLSYNVGLKFPYHVFCPYYDDLWYPGSDDVLVYDVKNTFCVGISHEEIVSFWKIA